MALPALVYIPLTGILILYQDENASIHSRLRDITAW